MVTGHGLGPAAAQGPCYASRIVDPQRQSIPEAGAYRMVHIVLRDLEAAARILERIDTP